MLGTQGFILQLAFIPFVAALVSTACKEPARERVQVDSAATGAAAEAPTSAVNDTVGSGSTTWSLGVLKMALREIGLDPIGMGEVRQPFMGGPGMRYRLNGSELQAYVYADAGAVARDTDRLDRVTVSPPGMLIHWRMPATLIVSNNLALILLTNDSHLRTRIRDAVKPDLTRHDTAQFAP